MFDRRKHVSSRPRVSRCSAIRTSPCSGGDEPRHAAGAITGRARGRSSRRLSTTSAIDMDRMTGFLAEDPENEYGDFFLVAGAVFCAGVTRETAARIERVLRPMDRAAVDCVPRPRRLALPGAHAAHPLDRGIDRRAASGGPSARPGSRARGEGRSASVGRLIAAESRTIGCTPYARPPSPTTNSAITLSPAATTPKKA